MTKKFEGQTPWAADSPPPPHYKPELLYENMVHERDVMVPMRDGVRLCIDTCRPDAPGKFPALLAFSLFNKDMQTPDFAEGLPPQPSWSRLWCGPIEAGDTEYLVSRGYVHVIGGMRGGGKSEGGGSPAWDLYDLIEWIAQQPWCDGNVGMIGISAFAAAQFMAAMQQPPHLKAIFPFDPGGAYGGITGFRGFYPGGVLHTFMYILFDMMVDTGVTDRPETLSREAERLWKEAMNNPDYRMYPNIYNVLSMKGQHMPDYFSLLIDPFDKEETVKSTEEGFEKIEIPVYTGAGWYAYGISHLQGAQDWYNGIKVPKKLMFIGHTFLDRPFRSFHDEILRWYDYWLKGKDTGIMDEPPVKFWVMGANEWHYANDWPLPETRWTKVYLHSWERLREEPFTPSSRDGYKEPDAFVQMPPTQTNTIQGLRYMTDPLPEDILVAGPIALHLYASIDQEDTNWIVTLKDVGPDESVRTERDEECELPTDLPERELTRGWLKASHRAVDPERSKPWKPWHPLTRKAWKPVVPGEINEYEIKILSTANLFKKGHRICLDITSLDLASGTGGLHSPVYMPYHICSSKTTVHKIYHNEKYPSHLLLPVIPGDASP